MATPDEHSAAGVGLEGDVTLLRELFEQSPSPVLVHDGRVIRAANQAAVAYFRFMGIDSAIGSPIIDRIHPEDRVAMAARIDALLASGVTEGPRVERFIATDGRVLCGETFMALLPDHGVRLVHMAISDVTEREETARGLREAEERYRRLFDLSPDPMIVHDGERILQVNEAAARYLGHPVRELIGMHPLGVVHPDSHVRVTGRIGEMFATGNRPPRSEVLLLGAHGETLVAEVSSAVVSLAGHPAIVSVLRDLTETRETEDALRISEERFRSIVRSAPMGMHLYRLEQGERLVFVGANPAADKILGVDNEEFIGRTIEEAFPALAGTEIPDAYRTVAITGRPWSTEQVNYEEGGIAGAYEVHAFRTSANNVAVMFLDVTARQRLESERNEYRARLEEKVRERTDELSTVRSELDAITGVVVKAVELRDPYTAGHQQRVALLAEQIAIKLGMPSEEVEQVRVAAVLHDIGKLSVPAEILAKPGSLSAAEQDLVKSHPQAAYQILCDVELDWPLSQTVLQHHERLDGSGYPQALHGDQIHIGARILAVADVVEAMSSHRPYRPSVGNSPAIAEILANRGVLYDPEVVDACVAVFESGFSFE